MSGQAKRTTATDQRASGVLSRSACALIAALLALASLAASASAAITHLPEPFSPLTGSGSGLTLTEPQRIAIDEATGNVFVTDRSRVAILGAEGGAPVGLAAPFEISGLTLGFWAGLAFDNSATSPARGTLYVAEEGQSVVRKYIRNPTSERYEPAGELTLTLIDPPRITLSVDRDGKLYVSQVDSPFTGGHIYVYSPSGALLNEYFFPTGSFTESSPVIEPGQLAVDSSANLFVSEGPSGLYKFPANPSGQIDPKVYARVEPGRSQGVAIDPSTEHIYAARTNSIAEYNALGARISEFGSGIIGYSEQIAFNSITSRLYVAEPSVGGGHASVDVFGPPVLVPTTTVSSASDVTGTKATLNGSVNPEGLAVTECFFEWGLTTSYGNTAPCSALPPTDSEPHPVKADISGLTPNLVTYHLRLVAANTNGKERSADQTLTTAATVVTDAATGRGPAAATLNGTVRPEGLQYSDCKFEYGLTTTAGFEASTPCIPPAGSIPPDFAPHSVSAALTGLQPNTAYKFRLTATNPGGTLSGQTLTFATQGAPQISEVRARDADQSSATLEAKIDPRGFGTSYHFEWGPTSAYGNSVPASSDAFIGSGESPVRVTATLSGLSQGTVYHYRIVARSASGTSASADRIVETLNSCGLPEGRCAELVSPRDVGPVAVPGEQSAETEPYFQAAPAGPGGLAYAVEAGFPDATTGANVLYAALRTATGWTSAQLSAPLLERTESSGEGSQSGQTMAISKDLSCAVIASAQPLTANSTARALAEAGGSNLYIRNAAGGYSLITDIPPENAATATSNLFGDEYRVVGMSDSCGKVVFESPYRYPGISGLPNTSDSLVYEWDHGTIRNVGVVPGAGGEVDAPAFLGELRWPNVVSSDGSRVFFSAQRQKSENPAEVGVPGVFVREHGTRTRDLSLSATAIPSERATYQYATDDGSRAFFTANAGLTAETSTEGIDLYEYNLDQSTMTDLSVADEPGGAQVGGFLGASADGSVVYFAAKGQLVPGRGATFAENDAAKTFSVYRRGADGTLSFVGAVRLSDLEGAATINRTNGQMEWTSRVSRDGRFLLFESSAAVTSYSSGGSRQAYLYDASTGRSGTTVCISCRQDDRPSHAAGSAFRPLEAGRSANPLHAPQSLTLRNGQPQVSFRSLDRLAPGAAENEVNLYEWSHDQVFRLATTPPGLTNPGSVIGGYSSSKILFAGASSDGTDLYFVTSESLNWEDTDARSSVYDARIGGGFPKPPPPPGACNPTTEGSCQAPAGPAVAAPGAGSATFVGPGNHRSKKHKKKHHKDKKKHHKDKHHKKAHKGKHQKGKHHKKAHKGKHRGDKHQNRAFDQDRRAGK